MENDDSTKTFEIDTTIEESKTPKPKKVKSFTEKINAPTALSKDIRASGVCGKCRKRYTAVPVINGAPQCPTCDKLWPQLL